MVARRTRPILGRRLPRSRAHRLVPTRELEGHRPVVDRHVLLAHLQRRAAVVRSVARRPRHAWHARAASYSSLMGTLSISCESESISFTSSTCCGRSASRRRERSPCRRRRRRRRPSAAARLRVRRCTLGPSPALLPPHRRGTCAPASPRARAPPASRAESTPTLSSSAVNRRVRTRTRRPWSAHVSALDHRRSFWRRASARCSFAVSSRSRTCTD